MKSRSPKRTLVMTAHEAVGLRRLLLRILDREVHQEILTERMVMGLYNKMQAIYGYGTYNAKERVRLGYRKPKRKAEK